jgi:polysaccharide biosynthesis/export protein
MTVLSEDLQKIFKERTSIMNKFYILCALPILLLLGGCANLEYSSFPIDPEPVATEEKTREDITTYHLIQAGDTLEVFVYENSDLNTKLQVSPGGEITFPLIGSLKVAGLTAHEVENLLEKRLAEYIVNPRVNIIVPQIAERIAERTARRLEEEKKALEDKLVVYVSGQVRKPGSYRLTPGMTVYRAITVAGGLTDIAAPNSTRVVRTHEDKISNIPVRIAAMLRSGDMSGDIQLMPGDTIIVPESFF